MMRLILITLFNVFFLLNVYYVYAEIIPITQWVARYNGRGPDGICFPIDTAKNISLDHQGNIIVTGYSPQPESCGGNYVVVKYNQGGIKLWTGKYNRTGQYTISDKTQTAIDIDDNVYIAGETNGVNGNMFVKKFDSNGNQLWLSIYTSSYGSEASSIALDPSGNVYLGGRIRDAYGFNDFLLVKYDANGNLLWEKTYNGGSQDEIRSVKLDVNGNV